MPSSYSKASESYLDIKKNVPKSPALVINPYFTGFQGKNSRKDIFNYESKLNDI